LDEHGPEWEFRRGLPWLLVKPSKFLTKHGASLAATEAFAWVDDLRFERLSSAGLKKLLASLLMDGIVTLRLWHARIRTPDVAALAASPHVARLRALDLHGCWISAEGARALARSPHLANLTELNLSYNAIRYDGAVALAKSPYLRRLERLWLDGNDISTGAARALVESESLKSLRLLNLQQNRFDEPSRRLLVERFGDRVHL
jgi:Ran GTPase-activating protein (RanGAP) involved in mRNA processing and transport